MELQENQKELRARGVGLAAISYDSVAVLENFSKRKVVTFPLLSDSDSKIIRAFGILNESVPKDNAFYGIPNPATYLVDERGIITSITVIDDYRERETLASLLSQQFNFKTGTAESKTETKQLTVVASSSNSVVRGGEHIRLRLDVELKPRMHVYAPGVEGYIPIEWNMTDAEGWRSLPANFPPSKKLRLDAINETVQVYADGFTLQREVVLAPLGKLRPVIDSVGDFVIKGALKYQACDDRLCYLPQTIPLEWKLHVEPHDTQRVPAELQRHAPGH